MPDSIENSPSATQERHRSHGGNTSVAAGAVRGNPQAAPAGAPPAAPVPPRQLSTAPAAQPRVPQPTVSEVVPAQPMAPAVPDDMEEAPIPVFPGPVFALVSDASTSTLSGGGGGGISNIAPTATVYHPKVRYIFADDDPEPLTEALKQHEEQQRRRQRQRQRQRQRERQQLAGKKYSKEAAEKAVSEKKSRQQRPAGQPGRGPASGATSRAASESEDNDYQSDLENEDVVRDLMSSGGGDDEEAEGDHGHQRQQPRERAVVLDLVPSATSASGWEVAWAASLSPDWAVVGATVERMMPDDEVGGTPAGTGNVAETPTTVAPDVIGERPGGGAVISGTTAAGRPSPTPGVGMGGAATVPMDVAPSPVDAAVAPPTQQPTVGTLMLHIEGVEAMPGLGRRRQRRPSRTAAPSEAAAAGSDLRQSKTAGIGGGGAVEQEDYAALIDDFDRRLTMLRRVVDAGDERSRRIAEREREEAAAAAAAGAAVAAVAGGGGGEAMEGEMMGGDAAA